MKRVIWKFSISDPSVIMPRGSKIVHVGHQGDELTVWAEVDPEAPVIARKVRVFGTGHEIIAPPDVLEHVHTWFSGPYVWHLYMSPDSGEDSA